MAKVEDIKTITLDENTSVEVKDLPRHIQELVETFNGWKRKEVEATEQVMIYRAALDTLTRQIIVETRKYIEGDESSETAGGEEASAE